VSLLTAFEIAAFLDTIDTCRDAIKCLDYAESQGVVPTNADGIRAQARRNIVSLNQLLGLTPSNEYVGQGSRTMCSSRTGRPEFVQV
jgi:hypothetical protein